MRILYCNKYNFEFSGTEVYLLDLMRLMRQKNHETALFSMADSRGEPSSYDKHLVPRIDFKSSRHPVQSLRMAAHSIYSRDARRRIRGLIHDFQQRICAVASGAHFAMWLQTFDDQVQHQFVVVDHQNRRLHKGLGRCRLGRRLFVLHADAE